MSYDIKSHIINISDNYSLMKTWLINNYGSLSRMVGDIVNNLPRKTKPSVGNRKEKFAFYSSMTGAIERLERLSSRVNYIDKVELESCLLSRSTLSSLVRLLPALEHDLWVREMTVIGLNFKNPISILKEPQNAVVKKGSKTTATRI